MNQLISENLKKLNESIRQMIILDYPLDLENEVNEFCVFEKIAYQKGEIKVAFSLDNSLLILEFSCVDRIESKLFLLPENEILISFGGIIGLYILYYIDLALNSYETVNSDYLEYEKIRFLNWERDVSEKIRMVKLKELF